MVNRFKIRNVSLRQPSQARTKHEPNTVCVVWTDLQASNELEHFVCAQLFWPAVNFFYIHNKICFAVKDSDRCRFIIRQQLMKNGSGCASLMLCSSSIDPPLQNTEIPCSKKGAIFFTNYTIIKSCEQPLFPHETTSPHMDPESLSVTIIPSDEANCQQTEC